MKCILCSLGPNGSGFFLSPRGLTFMRKRIRNIVFLSFALKYRLTISCYFPASPMTRVDLFQTIFLSKFFSPHHKLYGFPHILVNDYKVIVFHTISWNLTGVLLLFSWLNNQKMSRATQEHKICDILLNREFDQGESGKVLLTDITFLYYKKHITYLSKLKITQSER